MYHYFIISSILFTIGMYGALTKKRALQIYLCIELMFNAVNINFLIPMIVEGQIMMLFVITIAAAEAAAALALTLAIYRLKKTTSVEKITTLKN